MAVGSPNKYIQLSNLPGLDQLTSSATGLIQSELGGVPSPVETRTANAAWGAGAGLAPGTPFLENRGRRLYNSEVEARRRQGLQDLMGFLQGYSGTVSATPGQLIDYSQRQQDRSFENAMAQREADFAQRRMDQMSAPLRYAGQTLRTEPGRSGFTESQTADIGDYLQRRFFGNRRR